MDKNEELYNRLNSELGQIKTEVQNLLVDQHIFYEVQSIIKSNSNIQKPNTFNRWMAKSYATSMSVAVRRLVDGDRQSVSLVRLLQDLKKGPECVSREAYKRRLFNFDTPLEYLDSDYSKILGPEAQYPDPSKIDDEIRKLKVGTESLKKYVDKNVAHTAKLRQKQIPKFQELDDAIELLEAATRRWLHLFRGAVYPSGLLPTWQYDWKQIFHYSWIPNKPKE